MTGTPQFIRQTVARGRLDDVTLNSASFTYALNTGWNQAIGIGTKFRARFGVQETAGTMGNVSFAIQFNKNGGTWTTVDRTTTACQLSDSAQFAHGDATTQVLTSGAFTAGAGLWFNNVSSGIGMQSNSSELEWCLELDAAQVTNGDSIGLRVFNLSTGLQLDAYDVNLVITAGTAAAATSFVFPTLSPSMHSLLVR